MPGGTFGCDRLQEKLQRPDKYSAEALRVGYFFTLLYETLHPPRNPPFADFRAGWMLEALLDDCSWEPKCFNAERTLTFQRNSFGAKRRKLSLAVALWPNG